MPQFTHEGRRLFYRQRGSGPLLLILPGSTATSVHHEAELAHFSDRFHVACLDCWGTGNSDRIDGPWPERWWQIAAEDAAALADHLGYDRFFAIGCSGGVVVAFELAANQPHRVTAVVADSCGERFSFERMKREVENRRNPAPEMVTFWQVGHGDDWRDVVDADSDLLLRFAANVEDWAGGRLVSVRCPVLITASLADESFDNVAEQVTRMARQMPRSLVLLSPNGGHPLMWSKPDVFRAVVDSFLERVISGEGVEGGSRCLC